MCETVRVLEMFLGSLIIIFMLKRRGEVWAEKRRVMVQEPWAAHVVGWCAAASEIKNPNYIYICTCYSSST
jgi:hypothetical protein